VDKFIQIEELRAIRGAILARQKRNIVRKVFGDNSESFEVPSETSPGVLYNVMKDGDRWVCIGCPDFRKMQKPCKHIGEILKVYYPHLAPPVSEAQILKFMSPTKLYEGARRFPQEPYQYESGPAESTRRDHALEQMHGRVEEIAFDIETVLNRRFPHEVRRGPREMPLGTLAANNICRTHYRDSLRTYCGTQKRLHDQGVLAVMRGRSTMTKLQATERATLAIMEAHKLVISCLDYLEDTVIIDSTGFSPYYVSNFIEKKYGIKDIRVGTKWYKVHVMIGRISKAILDIRFTPSDTDGTGDSTQFIPLVESLKPLGFHDVKYVVADNTYLVTPCFKATKELGLRLVGPTRPRNFDKLGAPRAYIADMTAFYEEDSVRADELARVRNVVECVFGVMKRKDNHIAAIGTAAQRSDPSLHGIYLSRYNEMLSRSLVQAIHSVATIEHLWGQKISFVDGTKFRREREMSEAS
jgi:hypothetical protein